MFFCFWYFAVFVAICEDVNLPFTQLHIYRQTLGLLKPIGSQTNTKKISNFMLYPSLELFALVSNRVCKFNNHNHLHHHRRSHPSHLHHIHRRLQEALGHLQQTPLAAPPVQNKKQTRTPSS
uniref:Secreted protein n=1 Tax=Cacopsylla melanoneura TaxID=428564 RepID=A0A8D9BNI9_9HEMI